MKTYNKIMELFWWVSGLLLLTYSAYAFINGSPWEDVQMTAFPAFMALLLAAFRFISRTNSGKDFTQKK